MDSADVGYATRDDAVAALRAKPGVTERSQNDWLVFSDRDANTIWSITEEAHPAHPTIVKRTFVEKDGAVLVDMRIKCGASKADCDEIAQVFSDLNKRLGEAVRAGKQ